MSHTVALPDGERVAALGQGTWRMGEDRDARTAEVAALQLGIELGMNLIDTAEMYGEGAAENVVGEAIAGRRDAVFLVSKVYPHNASRKGVADACARSLRRLGTDRLDLYLLHWRGSHPLAETVAGFEDLRRTGRIRHWGVSNFDAADMAELAVAPQGEGCATDQVLYNLTRRGPEWDLLPWLKRRRIPMMAYSPIEQGRLPRGGALDRLADEHGVSRFQIALAWLLRRPDVIAIPKASTPAHVRDNRAAADLRLDDQEWAALDAQFKPPSRKMPLEMI